MALRVRTGGGTYTVTAGQAAGNELQVVSLAGTSGFSRTARVYGFSAAGGSTATQTRTYYTQTYTQTQTRTQPTLTREEVARARIAALDKRNTETVMTNPVRQWYHRLRIRIARVGRKLKLGKKRREGGNGDRERWWNETSAAACRCSARDPSKDETCSDSDRDNHDGGFG
ncbi:hypothetical protein VTH82DRAFT_4773 [Thermothelomyces myriococcoides]